MPKMPKITRPHKMMAAFVVLVVVCFLAVHVYKRRESFFDKPAVAASVEFFYMEGCGWCKKFEPEWEKFEADAKTAGIKTTKTEASEDPAKVEKFGITGFPTVMITKAGKTAEYSGERTAEKLMETVKA